MAALETLLGLNTLSNRTPGGPSVPTFTPNIGRNAARVAGLRKFFGIPGEDVGDISQADYESAYDDTVEERLRELAQKEEIESLPERIRGEYGLREARLNRQTAAEERNTMREFTAAQNELNRQAAFGRASMSQTGQTARTGMTQAGVTARQGRAQAEGRARQLEAGKVKPTIPESSGVLEAVQRFLGVGKFDPTEAARAEAVRLRSEALSSEANEPAPLDAVASYYRASGLTGSALLDRIQQDQPDATPEEINALLQLLNQ